MTHCQPPYKIAFLIRELGAGGAERQLISLAKGMDPLRYEIHIVTLYSRGKLEELAHAIPGVSIHSLGSTRPIDIFRSVFRFAGLIRRIRPHILHGYMDLSNIVCLCLGRLFRARVVWGIRAAKLDPSDYSLLQRFFLKAEAWLSHFPDLIIANSQAGLLHCLERGYPESKTVFVPNGIDTTYFRRDPTARISLRNSWGISSGDILVGLVGRIDPNKDYETFISAFLEATRHDSRLCAICIGSGAPDRLLHYQSLTEKMGIQDKVIWAGIRKDMPAVYSAMDMLVSSSTNEGFPNVLGEAMSCELPCIATDAGDSSSILSLREYIAPPKDVSRLASCILTLSALPREERATLGLFLRERVCAEYSLELLARRTTNYLDSLL